ncbi:hypothetical protein BJF77_18460 [Kocuria sp. CNJ-770]|uniref:hypothetical protein n=1 Tax=Kocuria sp. CNJ-770 TaxID=1904964 RepID=UPI0009615E44|nr:hypothetical protein [Kocuria sp. CNJ-770]OLT13074.1 hypothetical protein BJF77_18460 [Kocuria sp. CNJ-770]
MTGVGVGLQIPPAGLCGIERGLGVVTLGIHGFAGRGPLLDCLSALLLRDAIFQVVLHGQPVAVLYLRLDPSSRGAGDLVVLLPLPGQRVVGSDVFRLGGFPETVLIHRGELGAHHCSFGFKPVFQLPSPLLLLHQALTHLLGALTGHHLAPAPGDGHRCLEVTADQIVHAIGLCAHLYSSIP